MKAVREKTINEMINKIINSHKVMISDRVPVIHYPAEFSEILADYVNEFLSNEIVDNLYLHKVYCVNAYKFNNKRKGRKIITEKDKDIAVLKFYSKDKELELEINFSIYLNKIPVSIDGKKFYVYYLTEENLKELFDKVINFIKENKIIS